MKSFLLIILTIMLIPSVALGAPEEPTGFKGMRWGESVEELKARGYKFEIEKGEPFDTYKLITDDDKIAGIKPRYIFCVFWQGKLYQIQVGFNGNQNVRKTLRESFEEHYNIKLYSTFYRENISYLVCNHYKDFWAGNIFL